MATGIPLEDNYEATLTQALAADGSALTVYVSKSPSFTFPAGQEVCFTINPKKGFSVQENVLVESYDAVNKTLTIKSGGRAANRYNGDSPTPLAHAVGAKIIISDAYPVWNTLDDFLPLAGGTMTGAIYWNDTNTYINESGSDLVFKSDSQAEISLSALASASGSNDKAKVSATDTTEGYLNPKVTAGDGLKSTIINPGGNESLDFDIDLTDSTIFSTTGAVGKVPLGGAGGSLDPSWSSGGLSVPAGEAVDGSTTPQLVYISDGTGGRTAGRFYKADADDVTNMATRPIGFITENASVIGTSYLITTTGVISGFSGLTRERNYFVGTTAGAISLTPPTNAMIQSIGRAISTTELLIHNSFKTIYLSLSALLNAAGTTNTQFMIGFRPIFASWQAHVAETSLYLGAWGIATANGASVSTHRFGLSESGGYLDFPMNISGECQRTLGGTIWYYPSSLNITAIDDTSLTFSRTVAGNTNPQTLNVSICVIGI